MVDKTKSKSVIKPEVVKKKESKSERFNRLATKRVSSVLKTIRILSNCSSRSNYEYEQEQIDAIYSAIMSGIDSMISKFTPSKKEQESFKF